MAARTFFEIFMRSAIPGHKTVEFEFNSDLKKLPEKMWSIYCTSLRRRLTDC